MSVLRQWIIYTSSMPIPMGIGGTTLFWTIGIIPVFISCWLLGCGRKIAYSAIAPKANFLALALYDVREELKEYNHAKERKYLYAINTTQAMSSLRLRLIALVIGEDTKELENIMHDLRKALLKHKVPIRKNRTSTPSKRKRKHPHLKHPSNAKTIV